MKTESTSPSSELTNSTTRSTVPVSVTTYASNRTAASRWRQRAGAVLATTGLCTIGLTALVAGPATADLPAGYDLVSFDNPGTYTWTVPAGVTSISVDAGGARGGGPIGPSDPANGGVGGSASGELAVTPGTTLQINVGGQPAEGSGEGGFNGGGNADGRCRIGGGAGGGASDVRIEPYDLASRIIVAGGGGGAGASDTDLARDGGDGGGITGHVGGYALAFAYPGGGGTQNQGGEGGRGLDSYGAPGRFGVGGDSAPGCWAGGAGGGGYYGGGSGGLVRGLDWTVAGAGGGGSGYVIPSATNVELSQGTAYNGAQVDITWRIPTPTTTTTTTTTPKPTPKPAPKPTKVACPDPAPAFRVYPNKPSVSLAAVLIKACGYTARGINTTQGPVTVIDPPKTSVCPTWQPFRVYYNRPSLVIAKYLIDNCAYDMRWQNNRGVRTPYVTPAGWNPATRINP